MYLLTLKLPVVIITKMNILKMESRMLYHFLI
nr:MAG TPA: hypothetical protein [Caudoviricetes sp.]